MIPDALHTLDFKSLAQDSSLLIISQPSFKFEASLRPLKYLTSKPPEAKSLQTFFQEAIIIFLLETSPL